MKITTRRFRASDVLQRFSLRDDFTDTRAAGAVNGTAATPGPGTRVVVDTNSKISIGSGVLNFATAAVANNGLWLGVMTRAAGKMALAIITPSNTSGIPAFGWDTDQTGAINDHLKFAAAGVLQVVPNGGTAVDVGTYTATVYRVAAVMRATGIFWFIRGGAFANWTLLWITAAGTANSYPGIQAQSITSVFTADLLRVPVRLFSPKPLASDAFNRANGALGSTDGLGHAEANGGSGLAWTARTGTVQIATNAAKATALTGGLAIATIADVQADVVAEVKLTRGTTTAGLILRYVDADNYLYVVHNGTNLQFYQRVAGVETPLVNAAATYAVGAVIRCILSGTNGAVYYNGAQVGTTQTVPASSSPNHGLYFKDTDSTLDDLVIWPRGTNNEYGSLDKYFQIR